MSIYIVFIFLTEIERLSSFLFQIDAVMDHIRHGKVFVGVKKLLGLLDSMRVMKGVDWRKRVAAFVNLLEDEGVYTQEL